MIGRWFTESYWIILKRRLICIRKIRKFLLLRDGRYSIYLVLKVLGYESGLAVEFLAVVLWLPQGRWGWGLLCPAQAWFEPNGLVRIFCLRCIWVFSSILKKRAWDIEVFLNGNFPQMNFQPSGNKGPSSWPMGVNGCG